MKELHGKNALLTGGSRGIGLCIGRALASKGVNLALVARSADALQVAAKELAGYGVRTIAIPANLADEDCLRPLVTRVEEKLGAIDILINNAGIDHWILFARQAPEEIALTIQVNLLAPLLLTRLVLPGMLARGQGHIVTISSLGGKKGVPFEASYAASKAGLIEWTNALSLELAGTGVAASVICPMAVCDTGGFASHGIPAPAIAGSVSGTEVAEAVMRAIQQNAQEVLVRHGPTRLLLMLNALSPALGNWIVERMGVIDLFRRIAAESEISQSASPPSHRCATLIAR
jgi:short-subunit dehydrogenase